LINQKDQEHGYPGKFFGCLVKCYGCYYEEEKSMWGTTPLEAVIVMELAICDLSKFLDNLKNKPVDWKVIYPLMQNLSCALFALHVLCKVMHRDLKPENVLMFQENGRWKAKLVRL
jgi:serine/threonine protein kinase